MSMTSGIKQVSNLLKGILRVRAVWIAGVAATMAMGLAACSDEPKAQSSSAHEEEADDHADDHSEESRNGSSDEHADEEETIKISTEVQERFGISVVMAGPGSVDMTLDFPGEIRPDPDRIVHVKPPFAGVVKSVKKHVGDRVKAGEVLAVIESSQALSAYSVTAAIDGVISEEHVPIGETVDTSHSMFTIADTSSVWIVLQVPASDIRRVSKGDPAEILLPGSEEGTRGKIFFVSPVVDDVTRTASARIVLSNDGGLQPGLFVTGRVVVAQEDAAVSVPISALVREGNGWSVFVREGAEVFSSHSVEVGLRGLDRAEIRTGLEAGAQVVAEGAFLVKSAAARGEMGGGHGH